ncbi:hypothetical protein B0T17DRAFT_517184 [Bombardia bombarda]|uniref:Uncharacterized protein n=1 Tax=Bombardia bombarda TaxID=252184 RepID=A0AA39XLE2_9PEZI|nr:hypothetical protein B0T17DRAFT_517184 [Bombardia bombarda]
MNWTDGKLYRHHRGRLRKANPVRQRQREYFARAREREAEQRAAAENGPPSLSILRSRSSSRLSGGSRRSHSSGQAKSSPGHGIAQSNAHQRIERATKRPRITETTSKEPSAISHFFEQCFAAKNPGGRPTSPQIRHDKEELKRMRERLLAQKDWGVRPVFNSNPTRKRPHVSPENQGSKEVTLERARQDGHRTSRVLDRRFEGLQPRRQPRVHTLRRDDVRVLIGSQEKGLGEGSSIGGPFVANHEPRIITGSQSARHDLPFTYLSDSSFVTGHEPQNVGGGRSMKHRLPMTSSSDGWNLDFVRREQERSRPQPLPNDKVRREHETHRMPRHSSRHILTSSPMILQPIPVRAFPSQILSSSTLDTTKNTNSVLAQVGRAIPPVPSSQKAENDMWRSWLKPASSAISSDKAVGGSLESLEEFRLTPGASEAYQAVGEPSQTLPVLEEPLPDNHIDANLNSSHNVVGLSNSDDTSQILGQYREAVSRLCKPSQPFTPRLHPSQHHADIPVQDVSQIQASQHHADIHVQDFSHVQAPTLPREISQVVEQVHDRLESPQKGPEEAWRAFVFGNEDSDEVEEAAFIEANHDAARYMQPSDSSSYASEKSLSEQESNVATVGTACTNHEVNHEAKSEFTEERMSTAVASVSSKATGGYSDPMSDSSDMAAMARHPSSFEGMISSSDSAPRLPRTNMDVGSGSYTAPIVPYSSSIQDVGSSSDSVPQLPRLDMNVRRNPDMARAIPHLSSIEEVGSSSNMEPTAPIAPPFSSIEDVSTNSDLAPQLPRTDMDISSSIVSEIGNSIVEAGGRNPLHAKSLDSSTSEAQTDSTSGAASMAVEPARSEVGVTGPEQVRPAQAFRWQPLRLGALQAPSDGSRGPRDSKFREEKSGPAKEESS